MRFQSDHLATLKKQKREPHPYLATASVMLTQWDTSREPFRPEMHRSDCRHCGCYPCECKS
jgi:hypothetical protein